MLPNPRLLRAKYLQKRNNTGYTLGGGSDDPPPYLCYFTVSLTAAFLLLNVLTVIVAVPFFFALIFPFAETETTFGLLDLKMRW